MIINKMNKDIELINDNKIFYIYEDINGISISCRYNDFRDIKSISFTITKENEQLYNIFKDLKNDIDNNQIICKNYSERCPNVFKINEQEDMIILQFYKLYDQGYYKPSGVITLNVSEFYEFHELLDKLHNINNNKKLKKSIK